MIPNQQAQYNALRDQSERDYPETWIPSTDDPTLVGEFVWLESGTTRFGNFPIVIVKTEDGSERSVWVLHTALKSQLQAVRPKPGQLIASATLARRRAVRARSITATR